MKTHRINIRPGPRWRDGTQVLPVGRTSSSTTGIGPPIQSRRHPEHCPELAWGEPVEPLEGRSEPARLTGTRMAGEGSARLDQILPARLDSARRSGGRVCETTLRMMEGFGNGGPPWLAVCHREVDVGHCGLPAWQPVGCTPPTRYERARESIARLVVGTRITSNRSKVRLNAKGTFERCMTTRSCASDAEHEFPRIRSAGLFPMKLFRRSGYPQLLLMQPTSVGKDVASDSKSDSVGDALQEAFS